MLEKKTEATTTTIYGTEKNFASMKSAKDSATLIAETKKRLIGLNYVKMKYENKKRKMDIITSISYQIRK